MLSVNSKRKMSDFIIFSFMARYIIRRRDTMIVMYATAEIENLRVFLILIVKICNQDTN